MGEGTTPYLAQYNLFHYLFILRGFVRFISNKRTKLNAIANSTSTYNHANVTNNNRSITINRRLRYRCYNRTITNNNKIRYLTKRKERRLNRPLTVRMTTTKTRLSSRVLEIALIIRPLDNNRDNSFILRNSTNGNLHLNFIKKRGNRTLRKNRVRFRNQTNVRSSQCTANNALLTNNLRRVRQRLRPRRRTIVITLIRNNNSVHENSNRINAKSGSSTVLPIKLRRSKNWPHKLIACLRRVNISTLYLRNHPRNTAINIITRATRRNRHTANTNNNRNLIDPLTTKSETVIYTRRNFAHNKGIILRNSSRVRISATGTG